MTRPQGIERRIPFVSGPGSVIAATGETKLIGPGPEGVPSGALSCSAPRRLVHLAILGLVAGFLSGFLGIGGGPVIVPVLMWAFCMPIKRAVGTSLATVVGLSLAGVLVELIVQRSNIYWSMALLVTVASLLGSRAGARMLARLPDRFLRLAFAAFLLLVSYRMVSASSASGGPGLLTVENDHAVGYLLAFAVGGLAGLASVLFGIGGGLVMVPAFTMLFADFPFHAARATSLLQILPTAGFGAYQHREMGTVDFFVAARLVPTGLVGAALGVISVNRLPARPCQVAFAAFLTLAALRLLKGQRGRDGHRGSDTGGQRPGTRGARWSDNGSERAS
jgi:hypothetical protein